MLRPFVESGLLKTVLNATLVRCTVSGNAISNVVYLIDGEEITVFGQIYIDGTDTGELIEKSGTDYNVGAESKSRRGKKMRRKLPVRRICNRQLTRLVTENRLIGDYTIPKPEMYDEFCKLKMPYDKYHGVFHVRTGFLHGQGKAFRNVSRRKGR